VTDLEKQSETLEAAEIQVYFLFSRFQTSAWLLARGPRFLIVRFLSVVVITFALHAKGRGFETRRDYTGVVAQLASA
jgi:hypothetical protein